MKLLFPRKATLGFVGVLVAAVLCCFSGWHSLQGFDYSPSQMHWHTDTDGTTTTTTHIVDSTISITSLEPTVGKGLSISNKNSNGNNSHSTNINATNARIPTIPALGKSFNISDNKSVAMDWWEPYVDSISQPFHPWNGTNWCYAEKTEGKGQKKSYGLMLGKMHKAASSTALGVTLRIAHRVAKRLGHAQTPCLSYHGHAFTLSNQHSSRDPSTSFLWATVRAPHSRANSAFFFFQYNKTISHLSFLRLTVGNQLRQLRKREMSKTNKLQDAGGRLNGGKAGLKNSIVSSDPHKLAFEHVQEQVLQFYDFVAVTERWEESMVVMKLLLNEDLEYADFVVLKSKESGTNSKKDQGRKTCHYIPIATTPPEIEEYLQTTYRQKNPDYLLYAAVNRSLDLTIDLLGRGRVEDGVRQLQTMQALAQEECLSKAIFPCSANGTWQPGYEEDCYSTDSGCGYRCVDAILDEYTTRQES